MQISDIQKYPALEKQEKSNKNQLMTAG